MGAICVWSFILSRKDARFSTAVARCRRGLTNHTASTTMSISLSMWACGAAGSALPWHGRGRRFDPDQVHQLIQQLKQEERSQAGVCIITSRFAAIGKGFRRCALPPPLRTWLHRSSILRPTCPAIAMMVESAAPHTARDVIAQCLRS